MVRLDLRFASYDLRVTSCDFTSTIFDFDLRLSENFAILEV